MWVVGTSSTYFQKRDGKHSISNVKVSYKPNMGPGGCETLNLKLWFLEFINFKIKYPDFVEKILFQIFPFTYLQDQLSKYMYS